ncbi:MAG: pilus assembly protein [Marmoricola sp.]|nr:pilus assembly protein [Marmoricola sp.]
MTLSTVLRRTRSGRRPGRRDQRGAVAVEFALIVPLLMLLVFGILEFGYMLNRDTIISNASRDGARVASLHGEYQDIMHSITSELAQSGIATTSPTTVISIDCEKVDGTVCNVGGNATKYNTLAGSGATAVISVSYRYSWITPVISSIMGTSTTLSQTTQMRVE